MSEIREMCNTIIRDVEGAETGVRFEAGNGC